MLVNGSSLIGFPILSLHIGGRIATVVELFIDPNTLKLIAFRLDGPMLREASGSILPVDSVREFSHMGMIIDSVDELVADDEIIKIHEIIKLNFSLPGLKVITQKKSKLGKVADFTLDVATWEVYQLIVQRPTLKAFFDPELTLSRQSILEVNDYQVIVKEEHEKPKQTAEKPEFVPNFVNPFRESNLVASHQRLEKKRNIRTGQRGLVGFGLE